MNYKPSQYNLFVPYTDARTIVFNAFSGATGLFDADTMRRYSDGALSPEETDTLVKKGVLVPADCDEKAQIDADRAHGILQAKRKYIRIWTTSACNARCYYCFEKGLPAVSMTEDTAVQTAAFITAMLNEGDELELEWFGGEPLMNAGIIDCIIDRLAPVCDAKGCTLKSSFITNGSLITEEIADKMLHKWRTKYVQITLDGAEGDYDAIKDYTDPQRYSFHTVINRIRLLADRNLHVSIRMNYDTKNYESLCRLIDYLHAEFAGYKNIFYYVYPVWSTLNEAEAEPFCSTTTADNQVVELFKRIDAYQMTPFRALARLNYKKCQCVSCSVNTYTVYPNGELGKCSETFHQKIGDIWNGVQDKETERIWTDTGVREECAACRYLPLCQGGCRSSYFTKMPQCFAYKEILPDILTWYVTRLEEGRVPVK